LFDHAVMPCFDHADVALVQTIVMPQALLIWHALEQSEAVKDLSIATKPVQQYM
jgi:hypothetical protein